MKNISYFTRETQFPEIKKIFRIMKLTTFMILFSIGCVFASSTYSQTQTLNLKLDKTSVKEALSKIEDQSEFYFMYNSKLIDVNREVSANLEDQKVEEVLSSLFAETNVNYIIKDRFIVLTTPEVSGSDLKALQQQSVSGTVTDEEGVPLAGVTVVVKGTNDGVVTNMNGNYTITNVPDNAILQFSFVGMLRQEIVVGSQTTINVTMMVDAIGIEEVVAIGYGSKKKINVTGAVDVISNEQLQNRGNTSVSQLLVGNLVGLDFDLDRDGYQPGATGSITVRGMGSLNGGSPYVVIDGFPGDMNRLNPDDIESISVLKDAAASAIYGARAPYGVILITTKSGKKNKKLTASYNGTMNIVTPARLPGTLDSYTFARVINEASLNKGTNLFYNEQDIDNIIAFQEGNYDYLAAQFPAGFPMDEITHWGVIPNESGGWGSQIANNDTWDIYTGPNIGQSHNFVFEGGGEKTAYYMSLGSLNQVSSMTYGNDNFQRYNMSAKIHTEITDWWDFRYETRFSKTKRHNPNGSRPDEQDTYNALMHIIYNSPPTTAMYNNLGGYMQGQIQFWEEAGFNRDERTENWQIFATELRPLKG